MPRRREVPRRAILPDPKYNDRIVAKFINSLMLNGKKSIAEKILYDAFDLIKERTGNDPIRTFNQAIDNVKPMVEVKARRVGGSTYQVPMEVRPERQMALALRWLHVHSRGRSERTMKERLAGELIEAANDRGNSVKKREDVHRMAEANKAFAHYRW